MKNLKKISDFKKSTNIKTLNKKQMNKVQGGAQTGYDIVIVWAGEEENEEND